MIDISTLTESIKSKEPIERIIPLITSENIDILDEAKNSPLVLAFEHPDMLKLIEVLINNNCSLKTGMYKNVYSTITQQIFSKSFGDTIFGTNKTKRSEKIKQILEMLSKHKDFNLNELDRLGRTILFNCLQYQNAELLKFVIDKDADIFRQDNHANTPLIYFLSEKMEHSENPLDIIKLLTTKNIVNEKNDQGDTALNILMKIVTSRVINKQDCRELLDIAQYLMSMGANPYIDNKVGLSPLKGMVFLGDLDKIKFLLKASEKHISPKGQGLALERQIQKNMLLRVAISHEKADDIIKLLVGNGADVNFQTLKDKRTLLMELTRNRQSDKEKDADFYKKITELGADIKLQDENGDTALHFACSQNNEEVIKLLIKHDVSIVHIKNNDGEIPLWNLAMSLETSINSMELFLKNGANIGTIDNAAEVLLLNMPLSIKRIELLKKYNVDLEIYHKGNNILTRNIKRLSEYNYTNRPENFDNTVAVISAIITHYSECLQNCNDNKKSKQRLEKINKAFLLLLSQQKVPIEIVQKFIDIGADVFAVNATNENFVDIINKNRYLKLSEKSEIMTLCNNVKIDRSIAQADNISFSL